VRNNGGFEEVVDSMLDPTDDAGCEAILIRARVRGEEVMRTAVIIAATFGVGSIAAGPALADGGGGSDRSNTTTCSKGEVWDSRSQKCVKAENGVLPDKTLTDYAFALVKAGRYGEALDVLDLLKNPNTPVALNYRGYATRKLGRIDDGIGYYLKSVALDPHYAQVREYLGEAYLLKGDMARATASCRRSSRSAGALARNMNISRWPSPTLRISDASNRAQAAGDPLSRRVPAGTKRTIYVRSPTATARVSALAGPGTKYCLLRPLWSWP